MKKLVLSCLIYLTWIYTDATILDVPAQYPTIQSALNAASTGDTILVQPGIYFENLIWPDVNSLKLISAGDTSNTIIDGGMAGRVITYLPVLE